MSTLGRYWTRKGYACVIQDVRGKWSSRGTWSPFVNERDDGYDTISWVVAKPWSDGKVGMTGESYVVLPCVSSTSAPSDEPAEGA